MTNTKFSSRLTRLLPLACCAQMLVVSAQPLAGEGLGSKTETRVFEAADGRTMPYRLLIPPDFDPQQKYPLVLCLHGAGGRGIDNTSRGTEAFQALSSPEVQQQHPAFLLTPQCPPAKQWVNSPWERGSYSLAEISVSKELELAMQILEAVTEEYPIDRSRIYVTGQSMGGYGTWDALMRFPEKFAAGIPVCGAGDLREASRIAQIPIWAFHGANDPTVPPSGSREMIQAIQAAGGAAKYTEYPKAGHNSWAQAWAEPDLIPWLFAQRQKPGK